MAAVERGLKQMKVADFTDLDLKSLLPLLYDGCNCKSIAGKKSAKAACFTLVKSLGQESYEAEVGVPPSFSFLLFPSSFLIHLLLPAFSSLAALLT